MSLGAAIPTKRVLVVDDNPVNLRVTAVLIRKAGFIAEIAETAEDGLEQVAQNPPDLIVTDLQLPGMNGLDLARAVKKSPVWKTIPVILLTATHSTEGEAEAQRAGCEFSIGKPVDMGVFPGLIRAFLGGPASAADTTSLDELPIDELCKDFLATGARECRDLISQLIAIRVFMPELDFVGIRRSAHNWAGVGGTLGFPEITEQARALEALIESFNANKRGDLVRKLVELQNLFLHSVPVAQPVAVPRKEVIPKAKGAATAKPVILVGDDDAAIRAVIKLSLQAAGFECRTAADGIRTFSMALRDPPDAIILDLNMPRMSGLQVLSCLRVQWSKHKIPVILLTASHEQLDIVRAAELGATSYMIKPFDINDLLARLDQALAARKP
jgi:DNA-binding response OmpR family regulator